MIPTVSGVRRPILPMFWRCITRYSSPSLWNQERVSAGGAVPELILRGVQELYEERSQPFAVRP